MSGDTLLTLSLTALVVALVVFTLACFLTAYSRHRVVMAEHATSYLLSHPMRRLAVWERDRIGTDEEAREWPLDPGV